MRTHRFEIVLGLLLGVALLALCHWQAPGSRLSAQEIDTYMERLERLAPLPDTEKQVMIAHLRAWAEADDGQPVYNLNLMRYYAQLRRLPGVEIQAASIPEANARYEHAVAPMLLKRGVTLPFAGTVQPVLQGASPSTNLLTYDAELDNWNRVLLVRYPTRRAFLDLIADPEYLKIMPFKLTSVLVVLTPVTAEFVLPDLRLVFALLSLCLVAGIGWWRAERRLAR